MSDIDLYTSYVNVNNQLNQQLIDNQSNMNTNNRKSYYEQQNYQLIAPWYYFFLAIYVILSIALLYVKKNDFTRYQLIAVFLLLFSYPLLINIIVLGLSSLIISVFPKNVYHTL
jgi:hypothetical protein